MHDDREGNNSFGEIGCTVLLVCSLWISKKLSFICNVKFAKLAKIIIVGFCIASKKDPVQLTVSVATWVEVEPLMQYLTGNLTICSEFAVGQANAAISTLDLDTIIDAGLFDAEPNSW